MSRRRGFWIFAIAALLVAVGCGETESDEMEGMEGMEEAMDDAMDDAPAGPRSVSFAAPQEGDTIRGGTVQVELEVTGLRIVEAGTMDPNTGHHHLYLDVDLTPLDAAIPAGVAAPGVTHMGLAQTEYTFEGLAPGPHRLIALVGDGAHVPLSPPVADTVHFTVVAP